MTEAEKNEIVGLVMTEISSQAVDFDINTEQPQANDLLTAVRQTSPGAYVGVTIKWDDVARIATELANQAAKRAEQAETDANNILTQVQSKGTEITNFVATSKAELETQKNESVNAVKSVYQTDLNELKGDLDIERNARIEADTEHSTRLQNVELKSSVNRYEIENLKAKAEGKLYRTETIEAEAYTVDVHSSVAPYAEVQKIGGKSVVWNQKLNPAKYYSSKILYGVTYTNNGDGSITIESSGTTNVGVIDIYEDLNNVIQNHKYFLKGKPKGCSIDTYRIQDMYNGVLEFGIDSNDVICTANANGRIDIRLKVFKSDVVIVSQTFKLQLFDLTLMFGIGNEPTLEECQKIFSADYYPYDAGTIKSFPVKSVKSVKADGMEIGSIDVSSFTTDFKSAGSVHDEWSNGKKIKRVGERAYTSGDESESGYITDGTTTYYPLATPNEETVPEISNYIQVESGGTITFESDETVYMPVPSTDRFVVDLTSTTEEETT